MENVMKFEEYDFNRNPIVENQMFFLESKCVHCGLSILACSIEELIEQEEFHRTQCRPYSFARPA
jgi:predicted molibdopterin-dependent oxidoreductase YjgC